ncbi:MAG: DUF3445 domain-containing protein [Chloroflexota bacterium]|nr:DUF3445 domain-containing protein [Chloroflexota bacterium]
MREIVSALPDPYGPFLVRDDFIVRADLFPLPGTYNGRLEERHFELDNQFDRFIEEKLAALHRAADSYRCIDPEEAEVLADIYLRLFDVYASEYDKFVQRDGDRIFLKLLGIELDTRDPLNISVAALPDAPEVGQRVAGWIEAQRGIARLGDALALSCQEDIVIMRLREDGRHYAESLHVLLPSTWTPLEKYRQSFGDIHVPVAESGRLIASANNVMKAIVTKGPYVRFGLSLTTLPRIDSHPDHPKPWEDRWLEDPDELARNTYVRIERQTTRPFADVGRALFSVRIYLTRLDEFASRRPDYARRLTTVLRSASPAVVEYKGMTRYAEPVAAWCERYSCG